MAKKKDIYLCAACGAEFSKWYGRCPECGEWNSIADTPAAPPRTESASSGAVSLSSVEFAETGRITTGIGEFNIVCGGGIVPGSVILIGGEPGIGKSTLALQIASFMDTLYV
ncbi:MAG TPA: DNA repair protein RadA, partial [Spirochaetota bacterium]|nr:DNA repair protein RadA [Spirochaetota bacterium]